jgi:glycosyltransferase involved in cell wall biosynthesis
MKIAQVSPLFESVPPKLYGGTERVVAYLTDELVEGGHDVTLFASGDSITSAILEPGCPRALRLDPTCRDTLAWHIGMIECVAQLAAEFDVIHFHTDWLQMPVFRRLGTPFVTTLHGRLDVPDIAPLLRRFADVPLVSISEAQRSPVPHANWIGTVHHGVPPDLLRLGPGGDYLAFLGRISPEKAPDAAIRIAAAAQRPLRMAAKVDRVDREYFEEKVRPLLGRPGVDFIGEIDEQAKGALLGQAAGLLFPVDWPEPFGMVLIEAMACGTPVIAYPRGAVPEIVEDGLTGFIVRDEAEAAAAVAALPQLDRRRIRAEFERRFSARRMVTDYVALYEAVSARRFEMDAA